MCGTYRLVCWFIMLYVMCPIFLRPAGRSQRERLRRAISRKGCAAVMKSGHDRRGSLVYIYLAMRLRCVLCRQSALVCTNYCNIKLRGVSPI